MKACSEHLIFMDTCAACRAENFPPPQTIAPHDLLMHSRQHAGDLEDAAKWLKLVYHLIPLGIEGPGELHDASSLAARLASRAQAIRDNLPK